MDLRRCLFLLFGSTLVIKIKKTQESTPSILGEHNFTTVVSLLYSNTSTIRLSQLCVIKRIGNLYIVLPLHQVSFASLLGLFCLHTGSLLTLLLSSFDAAWRALSLSLSFSLSISNTHTHTHYLSHIDTLTRCLS